MGREGEITKGMSDREYVKHLKSTGNYKRRKIKKENMNIISVIIKMISTKIK